MFGKLEDKVAIITGAGQGIGAGIARVFAAAGANIMIATRTASHGEATVESIEKAGGTAALCAVDIGELENVERAVAETADLWGGIDIMVHNAASFLGGSVEAYSEDDLETVLSVNLKACFRLSKAVIPFFKKRGGGRLLFTSSVTGPRVVMPGTSYYAASKGGMNAFIRTAAIELARDNITVNGVEPGFIRTAAMELLADEVHSGWLHGRPGRHRVLHALSRQRRGALPHGADDLHRWRLDFAGKPGISRRTRGHQGACRLIMIWLME